MMTEAEIGMMWPQAKEYLAATKSSKKQGVASLSGFPEEINPANTLILAP